MTPVAKAFPLLSLLFGLSSYHNKRYCFPAQKKILDLLWNRSGLKMSIATLNRWLRVVEDAGYVRRIRRIRRDKKLGMVFQSTVYVITYKGYMLLYGAGIQVWEKIGRVAAAAKKKLRPAARKEEEAEPEGKLYSFANHKKRHPGVKLPWNHKGISPEKKPD